MNLRTWNLLCRIGICVALCLNIDVITSTSEWLIKKICTYLLDSKSQNIETP